MYSDFICFGEEIQIMCTEVGNEFMPLLIELLQYALLTHDILVIEVSSCQSI